MKEGEATICSCKIKQSSKLIGLAVLVRRTFSFVERKGSKQKRNADDELKDK